MIRLVVLKAPGRSSSNKPHIPSKQGSERRQLRRELSSPFPPTGLCLVGKGGRQLVGGQRGLPCGRNPLEDISQVLEERTDSY